MTNKVLPDLPINDLIVEVFHLNGALLTAADRLVSKFGLTSARWQILSAIASTDMPETVARLARIKGLKRQSVQRVVNEMIEEGMLTLLENPHHQRAKLVAMTEKGQKAFKAAIKLQEPWVKELSKGINKESTIAACDLLKKLRSRLDKQSEDTMLSRNELFAAQ